MCGFWRAEAPTSITLPVTRTSHPARETKNALENTTLTPGGNDGSHFSRSHYGRVNGVSHPILWPALPRTSPPAPCLPPPPLCSHSCSAPLTGGLLGAPFSHAAATLFTSIYTHTHTCAHTHTRTLTHLHIDTCTDTLV